MLSEDEKDLMKILLQIQTTPERRHRSRGTSQHETRVIEGHVASNFDEACTYSETGYKSRFKFEPSRTMRCLSCRNKFYDKTSTRDKIVQLRCPYCFKSHYEDYAVQKLDEEYFDYEGEE